MLGIYMSLKKVVFYFCDDFKRPVRSVEGDLRNMFNFVGTSEICAGAI